MFRKISYHLWIGFLSAREFYLWSWWEFLGRLDSSRVLLREKLWKMYLEFRAHKSSGHKIDNSNETRENFLKWVCTFLTCGSQFFNSLNSASQIEAESFSGNFSEHLFGYKMFGG